MDRSPTVVVVHVVRLPAAGHDEQRPGGLTPAPQQRRTSSQRAAVLAGASAAQRGAVCDTAAAPAVRRTRAATGSVMRPSTRS